MFTDQPPQPPASPHSPLNGDQMLSKKEAARLLNVSPHTLGTWAQFKRPDLKPFKIGGRVRYRLSVLNAYMEEQLRP